jgi:hypothetical protein
MFMQDPTYFGQTGLQRINEQAKQSLPFSSSETIKINHHRR